MKITALDHIVLVVADVARTCNFYEKVLGMHPIEHRPGQWALEFGTNRIQPTICRQCSINSSPHYTRHRQFLRPHEHTNSGRR